MKKSLSILLLFFFITSLSFAQLENAHWCFREYAHVDFNSTPPSSVTNCSSGGFVPIYGGGSASVSNSSGQLQFYTDGVTVWNRIGGIMTNGQNLNGGADAHFNQQHLVIVPKPNNPDIYYIFTVNRYEGNPPSGYGGIHYTVVNMALGANGEVVSGLKNIALKNQNGTLINYDYTNNTGLQLFGCRITTALNNTHDKIWVEFIARFNIGGNIQRVALSYLVSQIGINNEADGANAAPTNYTILNNADYSGANNWQHDHTGSVKISPNGQFLCDVTPYEVNLYNFNNQNGQLTLNRRVYTASTSGYAGYGIEFSPNSQFIYFSVWENVIIQDGFNNSDKNSNTSGTTTYKEYIKIYQSPTDSTITPLLAIAGKFQIPGSGQHDIIIPIPANHPYGDLQLAINNKIYVCSENEGANPQRSWLGVIQSPDLVAPNCNFIVNGIQLNSGSFHEGSLPQWVHKATVNIWPKVYDADEPGELIKVENGNLFSFVTMNNMANNVNHNGPIGNGFNAFWTHYNTTSGITNWVHHEPFNAFTMSSGDIQFNYGAGSLNSYRNGTSGAVIAGPSYVPSNESIIAEDNGVYITNRMDHTTSNFIDEFWVHAPPSINNLTTIPQMPGYYIGINRVIFNPSTKRLFVNLTYNALVGGQHLQYLAIYQLSNNTLSNPVYYAINYPVAEVNSAEEVFVFDNNGVIQKCNYQNNTYTPLGVGNNSSLTSFRTLKQTVEDNIVAINFNTGKIYCFNTIALTNKKISATLGANNSDPYIGCYFVDGNEVYLTGGFTNPSFTIGNQTMPLLGGLSAFVTKFNVQIDFSFGLVSEDLLSSQKEDSIKTIPLLIQQNKLKKELQSYDITATLSPNPAKNKLLINIKQVDSKEAESFQISIANSQGVFLYKQDTKQRSISVDISAFRTGMYYVNISNMKGNRITHTFIKE